MISARETFCALLASQPILRGDAIVVLCGEDAEKRLATGVQLLVTGAGHCIVLSGGKHQPPRCLSGESLAPELLQRGVSPERLLVESGSQNTREQAVNVVDMARVNAWKRLLIVASPYHTVRAYLTFLRALDEAKLHKAIHLVSVPCADVPWFGMPAGVNSTRVALLTTEYDKIDEYERRKHCASYERGLAYLKNTEGK